MGVKNPPPLQNVTCKWLQNKNSTFHQALFFSREIAVTVSITDGNITTARCYTNLVSAPNILAITYGLEPPGKGKIADISRNFCQLEQGLELETVISTMTKLELNDLHSFYKKLYDPIVNPGIVINNLLVKFTATVSGINLLLNKFGIEMERLSLRSMDGLYISATVIAAHCAMVGIYITNNNGI